MGREYVYIKQTYKYDYSDINFRWEETCELQKVGYHKRV